MPSEIFPSNLRGKGVALSTSSNWLNNFIVVSERSLDDVVHMYFNRVSGTHHTTARSEHKLRGVCLLRYFLLPLLCLDISVRPRDQGSDAGADGQHFQGC